MLTREAVAGEGLEGGFAAVYPVLRALEEAGRIRRGYFVDGLGAAQFALAGALDRLRAVREPSDERPRTGRSTSSPPPTRRTRTAQRCRGRDAATTTDGRSSEPRAPTSCSSMAWRRSTSSVAARPSRRCPPPTTRRRQRGAGRAGGSSRRPRPRAVIRKVDGAARRRVAVPATRSSTPASCRLSRPHAPRVRGAGDAPRS